MYPFHPGHPGVEAVPILLLSVVVLGAALALTLEGRSRIGGLVGAGVLAVASRVGVTAVGLEGSAALHVAGHGLELGAAVAFCLAGAAALREGRATTRPTGER